MTSSTLTAAHNHHIAFPDEYKSGCTYWQIFGKQNCRFLKFASRFSLLQTWFLDTLSFSLVSRNQMTSKCRFERKAGSHVLRERWILRLGIRSITGWERHLLSVSCHRCHPQLSARIIWWAGMPVSPLIPFYVSACGIDCRLGDSNHYDREMPWFLVSDRDTWPRESIRNLCRSKSKSRWWNERAAGWKGER